jgi:hypothetical protein
MGEQTTQWPKEKAQNDKQPSTKHTYKTKNRTQVLRKGKTHISFVHLTLQDVNSKNLLFQIR